MNAQRTGGERDGLTGLYGEESLRSVFRAGPLARQKRRPVACLLFGIDDLAAAGARPLGEGLLRSLATVIQDVARPADLAFRRADDRVLVLRPGTTLLGAWLWAEDVTRSFARLWEDRGADGPLTLSAGILSFPAEEVGDEMVGLAEGALALAERDGGDALRTWDWVEIDGALRSAEATNLDPEGRHQAFLDRSLHLLGPNQYHDLTRHSREVSDLTVHLGRTLGLDEVLVEQCRLAAMLHDLGKAVMPEELLARPSSLSHREWMLMGRHAEFGAAMAPRLGIGPWTADCIRHHHSRYESINWSNANMEVPLAARILSVADALVAMTSPRPYREAIDLPAALAELSRGSGTQFDPRVVAAAHRVGSVVSEILAA